MSRFIRKAILATAVAGALTALAAGPAVAGEPSVKVSICNSTPDTVVKWAWIVGTNQNGAGVTSSGIYVGAYGKCQTLNGYWWKIGTFIDVRFNTDKQYNQLWSQEIYGSNGRTSKVYLGYVD